MKGRCRHLVPAVTGEYDVTLLEDELACVIDSVYSLEFCAPDLRLGLVSPHAFSSRSTSAKFQQAKNARNSADRL